MRYDKLVRDNIPQIIESTGKKATYRILGEIEYKEYLEKKLDEEAAEFHESKSIEELADLLEVVDALCAVYGAGEVQKKRIEKRLVYGRFDKRICLVEVEE